VLELAEERIAGGVASDDAAAEAGDAAFALELESDGPGADFVAGLVNDAATGTATAGVATAATTVGRMVGASATAAALPAVIVLTEPRDADVFAEPESDDAGVRLAVAEAGVRVTFTGNGANSGAVGSAALSFTYAGLGTSLGKISV
jgi:hypothetical protein